MVMFFRLKNLLATFQVMMNKILRDLINTKKVASFINDIIVRTKKEEKHDEVVEEVMKRLEENSLYMKLKKYKQKVKEVEFIGVVIGQNKIKMDEEKKKQL